jgi:AcrR family transcriptional regulator
MSDPVQAVLIAARRNQILDAATAVFAERGFHQATIKDIARAAGIGDGTIYNYFGSKADLLLGIMDRLNETQQRAEQFAGGSDEAFRSFFKSYLRYRFTLIWSSQEVLRAILPEILINAELRERYYAQVIAPTLSVGEAYFAAQVQGGKMRPMDVPLMVRAIGGTVLGILMMRLLGDDGLQMTPERIADELADLMLDGILGVSHE